MMTICSRLDYPIEVAVFFALEVHLTIIACLVSIKTLNPAGSEDAEACWDLRNVRRLQNGR